MFKWLSGFFLNTDRTVSPRMIHEPIINALIDEVDMDQGLTIARRFKIKLAVPVEKKEEYLRFISNDNGHSLRKVRSGFERQVTAKAQGRDDWIRCPTLYFDEEVQTYKPDDNSLPFIELEMDPFPAIVGYEIKIEGRDDVIKDHIPSNAPIRIGRGAHDDFQRANHIIVPEELTYVSSSACRLHRIETGEYFIQAMRQADFMYVNKKQPPMVVDGKPIVRTNRIRPMANCYRGTEVHAGDEIILHGVEPNRQKVTITLVGSAL